MDKHPQTFKITWIILESVKHLKLGKYKLAAFLKGSKAKEIALYSYEQGYGGLFWYTIDSIIAFIEQLEEFGFLEREIKQGTEMAYPLLALSPSGKRILEEKIEIPLQVVQIRKQIKINDSELLTFQLLNEGKPVQEIAKERNLVESTIYTHCYRLIATHNLSAIEIFPEEIIHEIRNAATKLKEPTVKQVKELLPEISYDAIRCVLAEMRTPASEKNENRNS